MLILLFVLQLDLIRWHKIKTPYKTYVVDGYDQWSRTVYEFYGDYWHGNPSIYDPDAIMKHKNITFRTLYQLSMQRLRELKKLQYKIIWIWESDWNKIKNKPTKYP